jgi:uncharacterized membrane protein YgaE (UPF0421/DUF939 family)
MKFKIGMRNIKTAIAVCLCVFISKLLKLEYPFYAAIAAIISMESSITNSFKAGKNRMMGTIVGAFTGLIFASIQPNNALLCGLGIIVLIYICDQLKWHSSVTIAGIVFMAITVNLNGKNPLIYSANRIIDTFLGITVSLAVNYLFFPYYNYENIIKDIGELSQKVSLMVDQMICKGTEISIDALEEDIVDLKKQVRICIDESALKKLRIDKINNISRKLDIYNDVYEHLKIIKSIHGEKILKPDNVIRLKKLNYSGTSDVRYSHTDLNIVYNYHVTKVIEDMENSVTF